MSLNLGLGVALACALLTQLGFLCKHRGANHASRREFQKPFASARSLFTTQWFLIGLGIGFAGWALHVVALALAPLSTVQAVLSTGVVMLAVLGNRVFGFHVPRRAVGRRGDDGRRPVLLMVTLPHATTTHHARSPARRCSPSRAGCSRWARCSSSSRSSARRSATTARCSARPRARCSASRTSRSRRSPASPADGPLALIACPWLLTAIIASVLAFLASARGFQQGDAVPVIACTSTAANVTCILGGIVVFGDALAGGLMLAAQLVAFGLVAAAALLTPGHGHGRPAAVAA